MPIEPLSTAIRALLPGAWRGATGGAAVLAFVFVWLVLPWRHLRERA